MVNWETCVTDPTDSSGTPYLTHMPREYFGEDSFFGGKAPLSQASGWIIVVGMGVGMTLLAVLLTYLEVTFNRSGKVSSEFFNTAGRSVKTGLTASVIVSQWTWAATLLQSSNVAWNFGVSGPFWYASGATIQVLLFGILAIEIKRKCPTAHTMVEIVRARWPGAHYTFLFFGFSANLIVTSMLILGGAATINALCGMHTIIASFLIPISVIPYTMYGGLKSTFLASYIHTSIIFVVLLMMIYTIYVSKFSSDLIWEMLKKTTSYSVSDCKHIFSEDFDGFSSPSFNPDAADPRVRTPRRRGLGLLRRGPDDARRDVRLRVRRNILRGGQGPRPEVRPPRRLLRGRPGERRARRGPRGGPEASVMWRLFLTIAVSEGTSARAREAYDFPVKPLFDDEPCPSVYIYDHAAFWPVNASLDAVAALSADDVFGPRCSEAIPEERPTGQYEMAHIVVWRLMRPPRPSLHACRRTTDPALADLFLVPTFPGGKHISDWKSACAGETDGLASSLTYLDARTAHRHVFLVSRGAAEGAREDGCDPWWRRPEGLLRRALRFAYSDAYDAGGRPGLPFYGPFRLDDDEVAARLAQDPLDDTAAIPHLHSVPYPSSIHASRSTRTPPWAVGAGAHGASLASFVGETRAANHLYARVRPKLIADCAAAPNAACRVYGPHAANRLGERGPYAKVRGRQKWGHFCGLEETYARATFCLEPGGDSPYRKGFYDALATGCIPVVFGAFNARVAPWFVPRGVVVELNETAYLAGDLDVLAFLAAMPADEVSRRQELLAAGAVKVQYALDDVPGDAVETLLRGARRAALDLERARPTLKTWNGSIAQARPAS